MAQFKLPSTVSAYICIITPWVSRVSSVRAISKGTVSTADMPSMTMHESLEWPLRAHPLPKAVNHHGCTATVIPRDIVLLVFTMSLETADSCRQTSKKECKLILSFQKMWVSSILIGCQGHSKCQLYLPSINKILGTNVELNNEAHCTAEKSLK